MYFIIDLEKHNEPFSLKDPWKIVQRYVNDIEEKDEGSHANMNVDDDLL